MSAALMVISLTTASVGETFSAGWVGVGCAGTDVVEAGVGFGVAEREEVRLRGDWPTTAEIETIIASAPRMILVRFIT